jgi:hypothetical protein
MLAYADGDVNAGVDGKFIIADVVGFIEETLVFAHAAIAMCSTMHHGCHSSWHM